MEKHILSKSTFIRGSQCLKSLYLNKKRPFLRDRLSNAQQAVFKRGTDVGVLAQQLFPGGVDMKPRSPSQYRKKVLETKEIIRTNSYSTIYEAAFQYDQLLILLDILLQNEKGWVACEVKSSVKISETFLLDAAFQYYVITHSGVPLENFYLIYINKDYVLDEELKIEPLFIRQSVLKEVKARQSFVEDQVKKEKKVLNFTSSPKITIGTHCHSPYDCDFLGHCWKKVEENSLLYLDAFDKTERFAKYYAGDDKPENMKLNRLTSLQKIQLISAREKILYADKKKIHTFAIQYLSAPVMLSVFFVKPAVPYLKNTKPYQFVPVAALYGKAGSFLSPAEFFVQEDNPKEKFKMYFRNILRTNSFIIVYDKSEIINWLKETMTDDLLKEAENKLIDFRILFKTGALFHYLLKGDYSPENISLTLLEKKNHGLNPALLGMKWQRKFYENGHDFLDLKEETERYLNSLMEFHFAFADYLKNFS